MKLITDSITRAEITSMAQSSFGTMVKAVVDISKRSIALDAELHSDLEAFLLENGSLQKNVWGINLYPELEGADFIEFDSMINIRPSQNNRSRGVEDESVRKKIIEIVTQRIHP